MKITKVINNNIVRSMNERGQEVLLLGKALGFQKKVGDDILDHAIEKIYILTDKQYENDLLSLLSDVDFSNIQVVNKIVEDAESTMGRELPASVYFSLLDHVNFAVERYHNNQMFENKLHNEIKRFYTIEYHIGERAVGIINSALNIQLPNDEASFIAMHILNAQLDDNYFNNTDFMTKIINQSLNIVRKNLNIEFDTDSISYERFMTHLKFFSMRLIKNERLQVDNSSILEVIKKEYEEAYRISLEIRNYIENTFDVSVEEAEIMYLAIHINTFIRRNTKN
ncbi:BglG family transcription antiterminator LicT [Lacrimispora indolis]|uniref:BglG family transcription antiterminator LicT n=1 Tax=Lacrimispora indolis TaxID=69825 RepID=UPI00045EA08B|nr:PRD domain-containing protein [Lacrimispora indolis]